MVVHLFIFGLFPTVSGSKSMREGDLCQKDKSIVREMYLDHVRMDGNNSGCTPRSDGFMCVGKDGSKIWEWL